MNRDTLIQADVAGLAAGVVLAFLVRVLFGAASLTVDDTASFVGFTLILGGPAVLAMYALTGLYADNWRERGPWPAVAAVGWVGMIAAFAIAYQKEALAPMGSLAMVIAGAAIGAGVAREVARRQPPAAAGEDGGGEPAHTDDVPRGESSSAGAEPAPEA